MHYFSCHEMACWLEYSPRYNINNVQKSCIHTFHPSIRPSTASIEKYDIRFAI
jgi:hypothetical protein